ncbi:MAG: NupC/NupG family nucleoside CNT transporter [Planctomycetota bacterium]
MEVFRSTRRIVGFAAVGFIATISALVLLGMFAGGVQDTPPGVVNNTVARGAQVLTDPVPLAERLRSGFGYFAILAIAVLFSRNRRGIDWRVVTFGVLTQVGFALVLMKIGGKTFFNSVNDGFIWVLNYKDKGATFVFGSFQSGSTIIEAPLMTFAFYVLPTIIFFCCIMTVLYHLGVMQVIVKGVAWIMQKTMRTSGAETLSAASNIFLGQTEAPLLVKPFIKNMTGSELMTVMVGGFATIAGSVMALYIGFLNEYLPGVGGHLMAASVLNAPAGLFLAKIFYPEDSEPETRGTLKMNVEKLDANVIGAAARGASEGVMLAINVAAMLIAFVSVVALLNGLIELIFSQFGATGFTLERILGWVTYPFAWLMGIRTEDCAAVSTYLGEKLILTELWAYKHLGQDLAKPEFIIHTRSAEITTYALLGFANFASIGIQIGGIGGLAPERKGDLARLGLSAMIAGTFAAYLSACLAGVLL